MATETESNPFDGPAETGFPERPPARSFSYEVGFEDESVETVTDAEYAYITEVGALAFNDSAGLLTAYAPGEWSVVNRDGD